MTGLVVDAINWYNISVKRRDFRDLLSVSEVFMKASKEKTVDAASKAKGRVENSLTEAEETEKVVAEA